MELVHGKGNPLLNPCEGVRAEAYQIRREGYTAVNQAGEIREEAYRKKDEALELKEEALELKESTMERRLELETTLVETLALMKSQATATNLYIQEMRTTLNSIADRVDKLEKTVETKIEELKTDVEELKTGVEEKSGAIEGRCNAIESNLGKVGKRQKVWMSEIRLISNFKLTEENNRQARGFNSDIIVDGQFLFATTTHSNMRPYSHSRDSSAGNKLVIRLGGLFRIHKIKLWNTRDTCCMSKLIGLHVYADKRLFGTVIETTYTYDFMVTDEDPVYAETVTVLQPLAKALHLLEVQVWGNGPFDRDDIFA